MVFLPCQPRPASAAKSRSSTVCVHVATAVGRPAPTAIRRARPAAHGRLMVVIAHAYGHAAPRRGARGVECRASSVESKSIGAQIPSFSYAAMRINRG